MEDYPCGIYKPIQNELFDEMQLLWNDNQNLREVIFQTTNCFKMIL